MITTDEVRTWEPRVHLFTADGMPQAVAEELANFARLYQARNDAQAASDRAAQAVRDGEAHASQALAEALLNGTTEPRRTIATLEERAKVAEARWQAYRVAVGLAYRQLAAAVVEHADAWAAEVAVVHRAAQARLEAAVAEVHAAAADLTTTGSLIAMLANNPTSLVAGHYLPGAFLGEATAALDVAADKVREYAPVVPEPEVDVEPETAA